MTGPEANRVNRAAPRDRGGWRRRGLFLAALATLSVGSVTAWWIQRGEIADLEAERAAARREAAEWRTLRADHARLAAEAIPPEELTRLRADRVALPRLRAELDALRAAGR